MERKGLLSCRINGYELKRGEGRERGYEKEWREKYGELKSAFLHIYISVVALKSNHYEEYISSYLQI